jgi:hypothetical protein
VSTPPEREQNWYPVSQVGWFTAHIQEGIAVTGARVLVTSRIQLSRILFGPPWDHDNG